MEENFKPIVDHFEDFLKLMTTPIFTVSGSKVSLSSLVFSLVIVFLSVKLAKYAGRLLNRTLTERNVDSGVRDSLEKFFRYTLILIGILFAMDNLGVSINSLAAVGAVLMVGIGFGLQNIAQNFISGLILLIERPIKVGDIVKVGSTSGKILDIRVRSTVIQTRDNSTIIVPNSKFVSEEVMNESYLGEKIRYHIGVGVAYGSDIVKVQQTLCKAAASDDRVLKDPPPRALLVAFADSSINFDLLFWSEDIWQIELVSSDIRCTIAELFKNEAIDIPFPQRELKFKPETIERLTRPRSL